MSDQTVEMNPVSEPDPVIRLDSNGTDPQLKSDIPSYSETIPESVPIICSESNTTPTTRSVLDTILQPKPICFAEFENMPQTKPSIYAHTVITPQPKPIFHSDSDKMPQPKPIIRSDSNWVPQPRPIIRFDPSKVPTLRPFIHPDSEDTPQPKPIIRPKSSQAPNAGEDLFLATCEGIPDEHRRNVVTSGIQEGHPADATLRGDIMLVSSSGLHGGDAASTQELKPEVEAGHGEQEDIRVSMSCTSTKSAVVCRICRDGSTNENKLVSPCYCSGSVGHMHLTCLETWLRLNSRTQCELCAYNFPVEKSYPAFLVYVRSPRQNMDFSSLVCDVACFFVLTPLLIASTYLCSIGVTHYRAAGKTGSTFAIITLMISLIAVYLAWAVLAFLYHHRMWLSWRERNAIVNMWPHIDKYVDTPKKQVDYPPEGRVKQPPVAPIRLGQNGLSVLLRPLLRYSGSLKRSRSTVASVHPDTDANPIPTSAVGVVPVCDPTAASSSMNVPDTTVCPNCKVKPIVNVSGGEDAAIFPQQEQP